MKSRAGLVVLSIIAVVFLLTANFGFWLNSTVFDRDNFTNITVDVIQKSEVRNAISGEIVDIVFQDRPVVKNVVGDPIRSAISGLLASQRFRPILESLAERFNMLITSKKPEGVAIDISALKAFIKPITNALNEQFGKGISTAKLPDSIVLIEKGQIPSIYSWGIVILWVGPILGLIGLGIFAALIWLAGPENRSTTLKTLGLTLTIASIIFIILTSSMKSPLLASIESSNARIIAGRLFDTFTVRLTYQNLVMAIIGLLIIAIAYLSPRLEKTVTEKDLRKAA